MIPRCLGIQGVTTPRILETGESQLPGFQSTVELLYFSGEFVLNKEICACLNLQIVENCVTYNLWKFHIDSIEIEAWGNHETE